MHGRRLQFITLETSASRLRQRYFHAQNNRLINPRCLESRETLYYKTAKISVQLHAARRLAESGLAIMIFVVKQAVSATFIDFIQALKLQIHLKTVEMQYKSIKIEICAITHFHA